MLELGAGTGQLSEALIEAGLDLTAVEPLDGTRELLAGAIGPERVRAGRAEEIPLPDESVRAVFAADAFHWFDERLAMPEIKRVLQPGGGVAILRTVPAIDEPWSRELGEVINEMRPEHPAFTARRPAAALEEDESFGPVRETKVTSRRELDRDALIALVASFSWVATLPGSDRERMLARVGRGAGRARVRARELRRAAPDLARAAALGGRYWALGEAGGSLSERRSARPGAPAAAAAAAGVANRPPTFSAATGSPRKKPCAIVQPIDCSASTWSWLSTPLAITVSDRSRPNTRIASSSQLR